MRKDNPAFVPDSPFARPMTEKHMAFFSAIPKTELHCHLLGTTQKSTFEDLVKESGAPVTQEEIDGFFTRGDKPVGVQGVYQLPFPLHRYCHTTHLSMNIPRRISSVEYYKQVRR